MMQKKIVYCEKTGRYVERYINRGPGRARPGHDRTAVQIADRDGRACGTKQPAGGH